jgi:hypothetical protein
MVSSSLSRRCGLVVVAIVTVVVISVAVSVTFVVAVVIDRCRRCCLHCHHLLSPSWWRSNGGAAMGREGGGAVTAMAAQQRRWVDIVPVNGNGLPPLPYDDCAPPAPRPPVTSFGTSTSLVAPRPPILRRGRRHSRLPPLPSPPSRFDCCVDCPAPDVCIGRRCHRRLRHRLHLTNVVVVPVVVAVVVLSPLPLHHHLRLPIHLF